MAEEGSARPLPERNRRRAAQSPGSPLQERYTSLTAMSARRQWLSIGGQAVARSYLGGVSLCCCSLASRRAWLISCVRQPVKPPGPTFEQLCGPVAPTVASGAERRAH